MNTLTLNNQPMEKLTTSSKTLKKTTTQEIAESNFTKKLNNASSGREIRTTLNTMIRKLINDRGVNYISVDEYINFFSKIPLKFWSTKPVFYHKDGKFDALGFLGERVHAYTLTTKTLGLYFQDGLGMNITDVIDNYQPEFSDVLNPKERVLKSLEYLKENTSTGDLNRAHHKAKGIMYGRYCE